MKFTSEWQICGSIWIYLKGMFLPFFILTSHVEFQSVSCAFEEPSFISYQTSSLSTLLGADFLSLLVKVTLSLWDDVFDTNNLIVIQIVSGAEVTVLPAAYTRESRVQNSSRACLFWRRVEIKRGDYHSFMHILFCLFSCLIEILYEEHCREFCFLDLQ